MKKLDLSAVSANVQFPVKEGTIDFINLAYQEALTGIANNMIGGKADTTFGYVLWGCTNSTTAPAFTISAGAIYYNGEVYLVDAVTLAAGVNTAVANIVVTQYPTNADPVTFTDGVARNVHNIRKIVFSVAASGSGIFDFGNMRQTAIGLKNDQQATLPTSYTVTFEQDRVVFFAAASASATITFDFTNAVPGTVIRLKWTFGAALTLTINQPTGSTVIKDSGNLAAVASANNLLYLVYIGKNGAGNDEVSYTLKQF